MVSANQFRQHILDGLVKLGFGQLALSAYAALTQSRDLRINCRVSQQVRDCYPPDYNHNGTVLIFIASTNSVVEFVLAAALAARNYKPILFANRGSLPVETLIKHYWREDAKLALKQYKLTRLEREFNLPVHPIGALLDSEYEHPTVDHLSVGDPFRYDDLEISPFVTASARRYLQRYRLVPSSPRHNRVYREFVQAGAMIASAVEDVTQQYDVIAGITTDGPYVHGGIPYLMLDKQDIPAYCNGGRIRDHISFGLGRGRMYAVDFDPLEIVTAVRTWEMTDADRSLLRDHLPQTSGEAQRYTTYATREGIGLPHSDRFTAGVFSHLQWDGALSPTAALFPDFYEWLRCTIDTLADYPEIDVYLKAHPAEEIRGTDEPLGDWLDDTYDTIPSHIHFIPPDSKISFYKMIPSLDAGVVYASTVGAEMAYNHIPVVIGGYPPYIDYEIGFEPSRRDEYVDHLRRLPELEVTPQMHARCERFLFQMFVNKQMPFSAESYSSDQSLDITYELLMSEEMDAIIDPIVSGKTVQQKELGL